MEQRYWRQIFLGLSLVLTISLCMPTLPVPAQDRKTGQSRSEGDFRAPAEVDAHVAGMTDEQVRQAYAQKLKQESGRQINSKQEGKGTWQDISAQFYGAARGAAAVLRRTGSIFSGEQKASEQWPPRRQGIGRLGHDHAGEI